jgi:hypothetical protein
MARTTLRRLQDAFERAVARTLAVGATAAGSLACSAPKSQQPLSCPTSPAGTVVFDGGFPPTTVADPAGNYVMVLDGGPGTMPIFVDCQRFCAPLCDPQPSCPYETCIYVLADAGEPAVYCDQLTIPCGTGRRPPGLDGVPDGHADPGTYFAEVARLEAASVDAFELLAMELRVHGAPSSLVRRARLAARDEVRHARAAGDLSRRFGKPPRAPSLGRSRPRSLSAMALDNAVEGCVHETFGALVAAWQARSAADRQVRAIMRRIARDEVRHAALGWDVMRWANGRLGSRARGQAARAAERAIARLEATFSGANPDSPLRAVSGLPSNAQARVMLRVLRDQLWSRGVHPQPAHSARPVARGWHKVAPHPRPDDGHSQRARPGPGIAVGAADGRSPSC